MSNENRNPFYESESEATLEPLEGLSGEKEELVSVVSEGEPAYSRFVVETDNQTVSEAEDLVSEYDRKLTPEEKEELDNERKRDCEEYHLEYYSKRARVLEEPTESVPARAAPSVRTPEWIEREIAFDQYLLKVDEKVCALLKDDYARTADWIAPRAIYHPSQFTEEELSYAEEEGALKARGRYTDYYFTVEVETQKQLHKIIQYGLPPHPYTVFPIDREEPYNFDFHWASGVGGYGKSTLLTLLLRYNFGAGKDIVKEVLEYVGLRPWKAEIGDQAWGCVGCFCKGIVTRVNVFYGCYICEPDLVERVEAWELPWMYCKRTAPKWFYQDNFAWWPRVRFSRFEEKAEKIHLFRIGLEEPDQIDSWGSNFEPELYGFYYLPIDHQEEE